MKISRGREDMITSDHAVRKSLDQEEEEHKRARKQKGR